MAFDALPPHLIKQQTTNISSASTNYYINSDMLVPVDLRVGGSYVPFKNRFDLRLEGDWENFTAATSTKAWTYDGVFTTNTGTNYGKMAIKLIPPYSGNSNSGLVITYLRKPHLYTEMAATGSSVVDIPVHYHNGLAHFAAARFSEGQMENSDPEKMKGWMSIFNADKASYVQEMHFYDPMRQRRSNESTGVPDIRQ